MSGGGRLTALMARELAAAWRGGGGAAPAAAFFIAACALAAFAIGADPARLSAAGPGVMMLAFTLAAILGFEHIFQEDVESGALEQVALSPTPLAALAAVKILARALAALGPPALIAPLAGAMLSAGAAAVPAAFVLLMAAPGLVGGGAAAAALAAGRARGGLLIAVISPPLLAPTVIFAAGALSAFQTGASPVAALLLLTASSIAFLLIGAVSAGAALRMHLE